MGLPLLGLVSRSLSCYLVFCSWYYLCGCLLHPSIDSLASRLCCSQSWQDEQCWNLGQGQWHCYHKTWSWQFVQHCLVECDLTPRHTHTHTLDHHVPLIIFIFYTFSTTNFGFSSSVKHCIKYLSFFLKKKLKFTFYYYSWIYIYTYNRYYHIQPWVVEFHEAWEAACWLGVTGCWGSK